MKYSPAPGLEVVRLDDERFLLRSDFVALELSGDAGAELVEHVLRSPHPLSLDEVARLMPRYRRESLEEELRRLVAERVLVSANRAYPPRQRQFAALLDALGMDVAAALDRLAQASVAVLGLEAHGALVARELADAGVGRLLLADPNAEAEVARALARDGLELRTSDGAAVDREAVFEIVGDAQLAIVCWDRGLGAAAHWANEAAVEHDVPALFSELHGTKTFAGPLVLPHRSACWMCFRMRSLACESDFERAMAYEEHLDRARTSRLVERPLLPALAGQLASLLALEAIKLLVKLDQPKLAGKVIEFDGVASELHAHPVLAEPACSVCGKKAPRRHPRADELSPGPTTAPSVEALVSHRTGIASSFAPVGRDATEPPLPLVWRARLANHRFLTKPDASHLVASGKGFTREAAWASCLGEAVERYAGGRWDPHETTLARRAELEGRSVDPAELVLFSPDELEGLPYTPYDPDRAVRWVQGRSLVYDDLVWVPAISVFMEFEALSEAEYLCPVTSNGLAGGPTLYDAVLRAVYEVVERDAFLITWMNRLPARQLDASTHPDADVRRLAEAYARRGVELAMYRVATDHPVAVVAAVAFQRGGYGGPFATVGLGADIDTAAAARSAALEVGQVRPTFRSRARRQDAGRIRELADDPSQVTTLEDHALLYAEPSDAFAFLEGEPMAWPPAPADDPLPAILEHFRAVDQEVAYVNLTSPDLEPLGLHTARALLPGFQPIAFGSHERRLGGRRLYELPWRLGLREAPTDAASLNPLPHPIA